MLRDNGSPPEGGCLPNDGCPVESWLLGDDCPIAREGGSSDLDMTTLGGLVPDVPGADTGTPCGAAVSNSIIGADICGRYMLGGAAVPDDITGIDICGGTCWMEQLCLTILTSVGGICWAEQLPYSGKYWRVF